MVSEEEKKRSRRFWRKAFILYAIIEIIILGVQYFVTRSQCEKCVLPPAFYIVNWLQHILFTGLLWYCLNLFYRLPGWQIILLNVVLFCLHYFLWITVLYFIFRYGGPLLVWETISPRSFEWFVYGSWADIGKYVLKLSAFYLLKFYFEYRRAERQRIQLAVINKDMQINLLKQQLSPHFYFNTLNNLYGLARSNSSKLSDALHQLSNIMRYVIVDCNQPKVLLSEEIKFLQSYIALEKLRYEQDTVIEMDVKGAAGDQQIIPLLLIQFVENAFKHGMKEKSEKNWMKVEVAIQNEELLFRVQNSYYGTATADGIGIHSVRRILDLQYEGKYSLEMLDGDNCFLVTLKLILL